MSRTTSTYLTLATGTDERMLYLNSSSCETFAVFNLLDAVEAARSEDDADEPDYGLLTEYVVEMVNDGLLAGGFQADRTEQLVSAVRTFVTPGAPYEPRQVRFAVRRLPATDSRQVLTGDEPTLLTVAIDDDDRIDGSRKDEVPTILLSAGPDGINWSVRMTWDETKELIQALSEVVGVAENG